jgi:hypothetical protein
VQHKAQAAKEVSRSGLSAQVRLNKRCRKVAGCGNLAAVLTSKVSSLAGLGLRGIAHDELATVGGVEVRCCGSAVAVGWDGKGVDVPGGVTQLVYVS